MGRHAVRAPRGVELSQEEAFRFDRLAHTLLQEALFEYDQFNTVDRRRVDLSRWREYKQDDDVTIYREKHGGDEGLVADDHTATSTRRTTARYTAFAPPQSQYAAPVKAKSTPRLLATGTITSSLDDVFYGIVTPTASAMRLHASYTNNDEFVDGTVLATVRSPTPSDPFQFLGVKWLLQRGMGGGLVRPRDFLFLESSGVHIKQDGSGQRVGFHLMHSVDLPQCQPPRRGSGGSVQRGAFSTCSLYHELSNGRGVDVYMTALVQPRGNLIAPLAMRAAATMLCRNWRSLALCAETKKLAYLLQTHRQLNAHTAAATPPNSRCGLCSKSLKGFAKKKRACQLCAMTVCTHCSMERTLHSEGFARNSVVASAMLFCKKCVALASEENATAIASQQLWEDEIVRTGRAHTQTALVLARRETNASRLQNYTMDPRSSASAARLPYQQLRDTLQHRSTWHDTDPGRRYNLLDKTDNAPATAPNHRGSAPGVSATRRTINSTWNGSARATERLSLGNMDYRNSLLPTGSHGEDAGEDEMRGRDSTASSALVLLDDRKSTRRMKALDYLPHGGELSSATASSTASGPTFRRRGSDHERMSIASSSMNTEAEYEVESVYSRASMSSSVALLDFDNNRGETNNFHNATDTITEEEDPANSYYGEQESSCRARVSSARVHFQDQHERPSYHQQQQDRLSYARPSEILRRSSVGRNRGAHSVGSDSEQRLSYQMQLWLQMNELRDTAESTYQVTKKNAEAMNSMRFFSQQPLRTATSSSFRPQLKSAVPPAPLSAQPTMGYARRYSGANNPSPGSSMIPLSL